MGRLNTGTKRSNQDHSGDMMEEPKKELTPQEKIIQILDQFMQEEMGNRLSQFAMLTLKSIIVEELKKLEEKKENG